MSNKIKAVAKYCSIFKVDKKTMTSELCVSERLLLCGQQTSCQQICRLK